MRLTHLVLVVLVAACTPSKGAIGVTEATSESTADPTDPGKADGPTATFPTTVPLPELLACHSAGALPAATGAFEHTSSEILSATLDPDHSADDLLFTDAGDVVFEAKFAYGGISQDLQDEAVEVWVDDCSGAPVLVGIATTDTDGRIALSASPTDLPGFGSFGVVYRVSGDASTVSADLRIFPMGTRVMVTDIDGTLTTSDTELFTDLFAELAGGTYVPEERVDSVEALWTRTDQGYPLVYLTGRPYGLTQLTRDWLADLGYPAGTVQLVADVAEILPNNGAVGTFKLRYLDTLVSRGFVLDAAYGNATTDIYAFLGAGIPPERAFILGTHGGEDGTTALGETYTDHVADIVAEPAAVQPFRW